MDCYDEILELIQEKDRIDKGLRYLTDLIIKKSKYLSKLQFKNCLILTLSIWNPHSIDLSSNIGKDISKFDEITKQKLIKLLKSEFREN